MRHVTKKHPVCYRHQQLCFFFEDYFSKLQRRFPALLFLISAPFIFFFNSFSIFTEGDCGQEHNTRQAEGYL
jgi:hypothetical protein